ncbi:acyl carrier protein [Rhizobium sp. UBA1881]|jgi:acyl carrier protein|uniref:acyl carrier protein n=1 Tax=Rhizobium sp. UBA1881 TaxID=1947375 RepID=UPI000DDBED9D|nr:acyl carrier protein [Rhizobium sp. UBA1881]
MNSDMIRDRLVAVLVETLAIDAGEISDATLLSDISDDSLEITEAVMEIEAAFKVEIPDDVAENLGTVGEIIAYLAAHEKEP